MAYNIQQVTENHNACEDVTPNSALGELRWWIVEV
jgi:hypothetical protein